MLVLAVLLLQGCASVGYYLQAARGEWELLSRREPVARVLADPGLEPGRRLRIEAAVRARRFAIEALGLPAGDSYTTWVDLGRPAAVWSVVAAPEFSLEPRRWCFPILGCLGYRGWFSPGGAEAEARRLRHRRMDVRVFRVPAYSTLGWLPEPLLSTMVDRPVRDMVEMIFHELAHRRLYVPGDTDFNEAFATVVAREGVRRWLLAEGRPEAAAADRLRARRRQQVEAIVSAVRARLGEIYAAPGLTAAGRRAARAEAMRRLRAAHRRLVAAWGEGPDPGSWIEGGLDNAVLALFAAYHGLTRPLEQLLQCAGGDLEAFYRAAERLGALDADGRGRLLTLLGEGQCPVVTARRRENGAPAPGSAALPPAPTARLRDAGGCSATIPGAAAPGAGAARSAGAPGRRPDAAA